MNGLEPGHTRGIAERKIGAAEHAGVELALVVHDERRQLARTRDGKWLHQHPVEQAEDGDVGTDAEA